MCYDLRYVWNEQTWMKNILFVVLPFISSSSYRSQQTRWMDDERQCVCLTVAASQLLLLLVVVLLSLCTTDTKAKKKQQCWLLQMLSARPKLSHTHPLTLMTDTCTPGMCYVCCCSPWNQIVRVCLTEL